MLRERGDLHGLTALDPPGGGGDRARDQAQQGGLARAVDAQDARALAGGDQPRDVLEDMGGGVGAFEGHRDVLDVHHVLAQPGHSHARERDRIARRGHIGNQLVRGVDAELGLGGAGGRAAAQPREFLAHQVLALLLDHGVLSVALHALQHVGRVTALERLDHAVVDLPRVGAHGVQEPAVVGDNRQRTRVLGPAVGQMLGQPRDPIHVQVVGGLVQEDHIPVLGQQAGQGHAASLPAGELADVGVPVHIRHQTGDHVAHLGVRGPDMVGDIADDGVAHRLIRVQGVRLVQHAHGGSRAHGDPPAVGVDAAGEQPHERGFAVTVATDDADPVTLVDA